MSPLDNPYSPGAGAPPPELAGRDEVRDNTKIAILRAARGNPSQNVLLVGLRGVGKTVLLDRICRDAEAGGIHTVRVESPERRSLPALLAPQLRLALIRLSKLEQAKSLAGRALAALAGFAKALKIWAISSLGSSWTMRRYCNSASALSCSTRSLMRADR